MIRKIERTIKTLFQEGETVELRVVGPPLDSGVILNAFSQDPAKLAELAEEANETANVYLTLNPCLPALYEEHADRQDKWGRAPQGGAVRNDQVLFRRWLLIDIDPIRPTGQSATDAEKDAAKTVLNAIYTWLQDQLGDACLGVASSGNGWHLLLRLPDIPLSPQADWVCKKLLERLHKEFSTAAAVVDLTTHNAARISVVYGSTKRKGENLADKPHRDSELLKVPDAPADWGKVSSLVPPYQERPKTTQQRPADAINLQEILEWQQQQRGPNGGYVLKDPEYEVAGVTVALFEFEVCPFNDLHRNSSWIWQWPDGGILFRCHHDGCKDEGNDWRKLAKHWKISIGDISEVSFGSATEEATDFIEAPVLSSEAFYGPLGAIVQSLADKTEASLAGVLLSVLTYFGNAAGRRFYLPLDQPHHPKLYVVLLGGTYAGRKGTSDHLATTIVDMIDPVWSTFRHGEPSTGEGILEVLATYVEGTVPLPAMFMAYEFSAIFSRADRKGATISPYLRQAWDSKVLSNIIKKNPLRIFNHHVSLVCHVTPGELLKVLNEHHANSGFANRFLWIFCQMQGLRAISHDLRAADFPAEIEALQKTVQAWPAFGTDPIPVRMSPEMFAYWKEQLYPQLSFGDGTLIGEESMLTKMTSRQPVQACRLALIFALADGASQIERQHFAPAVAIVEYVWETVNFLLSQTWWGPSEEAMQPKLMQALQDRHPVPLTRTEILRDVFQRNRTAAEINRLRKLLIDQGKIRVEYRGSGVSRTELWRLP